MMKAGDRARIDELSQAARAEIDRDEYGKACSELARAIWASQAAVATFFRSEGMPAMQALMREFDSPMLAIALRDLGCEDLAERMRPPWREDKFAQAHPCWDALRELDYPSFHDASIKSWRSSPGFLELVFDGYFDNERLAGAGDPSHKALLVLFHDPRIDIFFQGCKAQAPPHGIWEQGSCAPFAHWEGGPISFGELSDIHVDEVSRIGEPASLTLGEGFFSKAEMRIGFSNVEIVWGQQAIGAWRASKVASEISQGASPGKAVSKPATL